MSGVTQEKRKWYRSFAGSLTLLLLSASLFSASFDCKKATTDVEKLICSNEELSQLDDELNKSYKELLSKVNENDKKTITQEQREWIKKRNRCKDANCIKDQYEQQLSSLKYDSFIMSYSKDNQTNTIRFFPKVILSHIISYVTQTPVPNTDPVCKAYVEALNANPLIIDENFNQRFFIAPIQPNSIEFTYPNWEQWDIYEYKDIYLKYIAWNVYGKDKDYFDSRYTTARAANESSWFTKDDENERLRESRRSQEEMYYARFDIDNDGNIDDVLRKFSDKLTGARYKSYFFKSHLMTFKGEPEKSFKYKDNKLNAQFEWGRYIYDVFFYKGKTYIKQLTYDLVEYGFSYMTIHEFDDKQKLAILCLIVNEE
ncbi:MAG: lysozyme inhibitor LprI family protein [Campylobacteraceae bacterium]|jgi:uncharacterized protein YecT (DUF1311 family)|nr:lysozyme inhibitor LprI family protein [Campylobacteraceae bacterium]